MQSTLALTVLAPTEAWRTLNPEDKRRWLENVICSLSEFEIGTGGQSGVVWSSRNTGDETDRCIYMVWNVATPDAGRGLLETLRREDVKRYFDFKLGIVGGVVLTNEDAIRPFLEA